MDGVLPVCGVVDGMPGCCGTPVVGVVPGVWPPTDAEDGTTGDVVGV